MNKSEQWKLDGNCNICRRNNYCSKPCTISKRKTSNDLYNLVANKLIDHTLKRKEI